MESIGDLDDSYERHFRTRANTWPLPRAEVDKDDCNLLNDVSANGNHHKFDSNGFGLSEAIIPTTATDASNTGDSNCGITSASGPKKNSSRRNAWGNMSYADLITQAIQSSSEKRLTLSQIYDWMVQNIDYFKDKGDSNSSAGWKNSIRHNLSLHNRFMRVQNEGTGKSSWWMINPDAKPGKAARRRATSMETQKFEKKRGRAKKKADALRNGSTIDNTSSPSSSLSEGLDRFDESPVHHNFQMSPEFRPRAPSNASSSGLVESDMQDSQVMPLSPLSEWNSELGRLYNTSDVQDQFNTEQLVEMANTMKLGGKGFLNVSKNSPTGDSISPTSHNNTNNNYTTLNNFAAQASSFNNNGTTSLNGSDGFFQVSSMENNISLTSINCVTGPRSPPKLMNSESISSGSNFNVTNMSPTMSPSPSMDTMTAPSQTNNSLSNFHSPKHEQSAVHLNKANLQNRGVYPTSGLRGSTNNNVKLSCLVSAANTSLGTTASQVMGHILSLNNPLPNDLELNFDSLQGGLECDVDQVIRHELSVEGNLDFNFDTLHGSTASTTPVPTSMATAAAATSHSWVH